MKEQNAPLYFVYELEHLPELEARLHEGQQYEIVALDYEIEIALKNRGICFTSLIDVSVSPDGDRELVEYTRALALNWYTAPEMHFFKHEGILLGEQHEVVVLYYLQALVYYLAVLEHAFSHFPHAARVVVPDPSHYASPLADPVAAFKERLPVDVVRFLAERSGIACEIIPIPASKHVGQKWLDCKTRVQQFLSRTVVQFSNTIITFFTTPRPIVLLASDPWSRLEPFVKHMPDVELIMTRRTEMREMGLRNIWRTRARFHHRLDFVSANIRALVKKRAQEVTCQWEALGETPPFSKSFHYKGTSFWPIAKSMFDSLIKNHTEDAIATIENTKRLCKRYGVNCVLLRISTKGYDNVLAEVAEKTDIPSIELQHALSTTEKSLVHTRLHSRYLAAYGAFTRKVYEQAGVESWRLIECGSPRFDQYASPLAPESIDALRLKLHLDDTHLNVLVNVPQIYLSLESGNYTSYDVEQVLEEYAALQKEIPGLRLLLRPKPGPFRKGFYNRQETLGLFSAETRMVQLEDLRALLEVSDLVISGNSALVLEAMLAHTPVIMYLPKKLDRDFQAFEDAGAVLMARTREELFRHARHLTSVENRALLVKHADQFLRDNFLLDGKSFERVAAMIRKVADTHEL